jgi:hypothetical protein
VRFRKRTFVSGNDNDFRRLTECNNPYDLRCQVIVNQPAIQERLHQRDGGLHLPICAIRPMVDPQIREGFRHHLNGIRQFVCACDDFLMAHRRTPEIRVCGRRQQSKDTVLKSDAIFGTPDGPVVSLLRITFCPRPGFQKRLWKRVFGRQPNAHLVEKLRRILRRIARRKGSKSSFRLHSIPLITNVLRPLRLPC